MHYNRFVERVFAKSRSDGVRSTLISHVREVGYLELGSLLVKAATRAEDPSVRVLAMQKLRMNMALPSRVRSKLVRRILRAPSEPALLFSEWLVASIEPRQIPILLRKLPPVLRPHWTLRALDVRGREDRRIAEALRATADGVEAPMLVQALSVAGEVQPGEYVAASLGWPRETRARLLRQLDRTGAGPVADGQLATIARLVKPLDREEHARYVQAFLRRAPKATLAVLPDVLTHWGTLTAEEAANLVLGSVRLGHVALGDLDIESYLLRREGMVVGLMDALLGRLESLSHSPRDWLLFLTGIGRATLARPLVAHAALSRRRRVGALLRATELRWQGALIRSALRPAATERALVVLALASIEPEILTLDLIDWADTGHKTEVETTLGAFHLAYALLPPGQARECVFDAAERLGGKVRMSGEVA